VRRCEVGDEPRSSEEIQASRRGSRPRKGLRLGYDKKLKVVKGRKVRAAASVILMLSLSSNLSGLEELTDYDLLHQ
jgi:hypothetical protein